MTGVGTSCGACKFLRRKCTSQCVFAPYFRYELAAEHFGAIHKVFGASNASRVLVGLPEQWRSEAAVAMSFEALARIHDPVYGCVAYIYALQQQVATLQQELQALVACTQLPSEILMPTEPKWTENNNSFSNGDWIMEDCDMALLMGQAQEGYVQVQEEENNLGSVCEFKPFEIPLEGLMSTELDVISYLASFHAQ